jgi:hypothetical protein
VNVKICRISDEKDGEEMGTAYLYSPASSSYSETPAFALDPAAL